ncbi:thioredoxin domain-containing protein [Halobaculum limi]|uniref:thioredoxin domain-containing protein n=1 Tax=Halobaculum limi TaxID=3031916 RepID=UPI002405ADCC|nr:thioredoxin domain-containing protein [Halobaculum sp. YSMS11]
MHAPDSFTRRRALSAVAAVSAAGLAGCLGEQGGGDRVQSLPRPVRGDPDAAVTITTFEDFVCPHCQTFATQVLPDLEADYIEKGTVRHEHYDFPIPVDDRWSWQVPSAARAVQDTVGTEAFFEFVHLLFTEGWSNGRAQYSEDLLASLAEEVGATPDDVVAAATSNRYRPVVESDRETGTKRGVRGTPAVFVNGTFIEQPTFSNIEAAIETSR